ncbi:MAG: hypothetical protein AAFR47_17180 [Pseudomonadota bacterium]
MPHFFSIIYSLAWTFLAGSALVVVLVAGWVSGPAIIAALAAGAVVAAPVAWVIERELDR